MKVSIPMRVELEFLQVNKLTEVKEMEIKKFLYNGGILLIEEFDELSRKKRSEFRILQEDNLSSGTQLFEYDKAGNITKRTVTHIQNDVQEIKESLFFYDTDGKVISHKELLYQKDAAPMKILNHEYRYVLTNENYSKGNKQTEYLVYFRNILQQENRNSTSEEKLAFRLVLEISQLGCKQLYYLPNGALSFQNNSFVKGDFGSYLSPVGGKWLWSLLDIDSTSATVSLYETILTYEIYCEIVEYCKLICPQLDFISFVPECFIEPADEVDRIMKRCQETDVWYGMY